jgi:hypothetical protein
LGDVDAVRARLSLLQVCTSDGQGKKQAPSFRFRVDPPQVLLGYAADEDVTHDDHLRYLMMSSW